MSSNDWQLRELESRIGSLETDISNLRNQQPPDAIITSSYQLDSMYIDPCGSFIHNLSLALENSIRSGGFDLDIERVVKEVMGSYAGGRVSLLRTEITNFKLRY